MVDYISWLLSNIYQEKTLRQSLMHELASKSIHPFQFTVFFQVQTNFCAKQ